MPRPGKRTRSKKRVCKAVPGGATKVHYRSKLPAVAVCSKCGQPLAGAPNGSPLKMTKLNRGKRRVWRTHGGQLCHECLKTGLKQTIRTP